MSTIDQNQTTATTPSCAFELADVLDGFFELRPRSNTLHGDAPVRAVQACPPFAEGCGFGWEIRYSGIGLALQAQAEPAVHMIDELTPGFDYVGTVDAAVASGLISQPWAHRLRRNWWWRDSDNPELIHLWTGLMVRPRPGYGLRITELYNSPHLQLNLEECWLADAEAFNPVILSFTLGARQSAIAGSVASLSPLPASSSMQLGNLSDYPWVGQRAIAYYSNDYYQQKLTAPPTRQYAKLLRTPPQPPPDPVNASSDADALVLSATAAERQWAAVKQWPAGPDYVELYAPADICLRYLGRGIDISMGEDWSATYSASRAAWQRLYGPPGGQYLDNITSDGHSCVHPTAGHPVLVVNIEPLLRFVTIPGWSLLFEGDSKTLAWGLRGIIRSSQFHSGALAFQFFGAPDSQILSQGSRLGRAIAIPDSLAQSTYATVSAL